MPMPMPIPMPMPMPRCQCRDFQMALQKKLLNTLHISPDGEFIF